MKRFAQYAVQLSAAAGILLAFGFGVNQALADPASETGSARACDPYTCEIWCGGPDAWQCNQITRRCECK